MSTLPPIAELLPHAGPMRLLERVVEHTDERTICEARASHADAFRGADGRIPAWVAIEWMAQCAGAHGTLVLRGRGEAVGAGFLTGGREITLLVSHVERDERVLVEARPLGRSGGLHAFACRATTADGRPLAEGRLGIFVPRPVAGEL